MKAEFRVPSSESRVPENADLRVPRSAFRISATLDPRPSRISAFTLIELLTVIAIIGILAALLAPVLRNFTRPDVAVAASRQMLDDFARARQLAISQRSTVYVAFVPPGFWNDPINTGVVPFGSSQWGKLPLPFTTSTVVTQMYGAQLNGYFIVSLRGVGDQPGRSYAKDLVHVRTLPAGSFIAPFKFTNAPIYGANISTVPYPTNRPDLLIYQFLRTNTIPFPTSDIQTNAAFMSSYNPPIGTARFVTLPYVAFNYLGQLTGGDGSVLPYDENIPLDYGSIAEFRNMTNKAFAQGLPSVIESPDGNSTNISYNIIHIDRLTGRARLERQDVL